MSSATPLSQPQNNPGCSRDLPQAPPAAQTTSRAPPPTEAAAPVRAAALDHQLAHDHGTAQQDSLHLGHRQHSHHSHHHDSHQHHHYAEGGPTSALEREHGLDLEAANRAHFDARGHDFDERHPFAAEFADRLISTLLRRRPPSSQISSSGSDSSGGGGPSSLVLDEDVTSVLDYACGSGQVSRALSPYVAQLVGVDISPRMVEVYNARANTQGLEPHEMQAVSSLAELHQQRFDLAVCSMAYHHFASVEQVTRELVAYLKPGGTLAVADIARGEDGREEGEGGEEAPPVIPAEYAHIVAHSRGFAEEEMRALFEGAGALEEFAFERFASARRAGRDVHFFLATGTKPAQ